MAALQPAPDADATRQHRSGGSEETEHAILPVLQQRDKNSRKTAQGSGVVLVGALVRAASRQYADVRFLEVADALDAPDAPITTLLDALSSAPRLGIVRHLLRQDATRAELLALLGQPSVGQLYHHLNALQHAGLVVQPRRGVFRLPPERAVPVVALLALAQVLSTSP